ncbi:protein phosphatase 2C domain-containing protein [Actinoplanes sp. NPDC048791]|uniref:protein phosphatase 2C domain-containing protein n=1 Tax=Actinoplanes sp. NPDC048791 TaxID=3154623 RepID=UPI0033C2E5B4
MNLTQMSVPAPGAVNDDYVLTSSWYCIVLDGATANGLPTGCVHDVAWYVARLATHIAHRLDSRPDQPLQEALRTGIADTCAAHAHTCDLTLPDSPSSTVSITRLRDGRIDYLVLTDSPVVFEDHTAQISIVVDDRVDRLPAFDRETLSRYRNTADGFWIASTRPEAADHALTGSKAVSDVRRFALLTDGITRLVDYFGWSWRQLLDHLDDKGPQATVHAVRQAERAAASTGFATKTHDDASVVLARL